MARTFNRPPVQVNTPSGNDVKNYFFNHYNWKGLTDNKNVLAVDQETFSDCKNVYIDSEGLLRSRPSLKVKVVKYTNSGEEYVLSNIVNVWTFGDVTLYKSTSQGKYYLTFVNKNVENHIQVELKYTDSNGETKTYKDIRPILADGKIFIFAEHDFNYYDVKENIYASAKDFIYVPTTTVVSGDKTVTLESPNVLTKSYVTKYLYDKTADINFNNLVGKDVTVEIDGTTYTINFAYNNEIVFVGRYTGLSKYNFADEYILGRYGEGTPLIQVSERESMLICSYNYVLDEDSKKPTIEWTIYHTINGVSFNRVPVKDGIIGMPKISRDGFYAFIFRDDGPWVYSLLDTTGDLTGIKNYSKWTNLLEDINKSKYDSWIADGFHLNTVNNVGSNFNQTTQVNGYFRDDTVFAFTYADNLAYSSGDPTYRNFYCVYCNGSDFYRKQIFYTIAGTSFSYNPSTSANTTKLQFTPTSSGIGTITTTATSNNITTKTFNYTRSDGSSITATATLSNLVVTQVSTTSESSLSGPTWGNMTLTGNLSIVDSEGNSIVNKAISFTKSKYAPVNQVLGDITSYNSHTFSDSYFTYKIESKSDGTGTIGGQTYDKYYQNIVITAKSISGSIADSGTKLPTSFGNKAYFANTDNYMPNLYVNMQSGKLSVAIDFMVQLRDCAPYAPYYRAIYHIERDNSGETAEMLDYHTYGSRTNVRTPIRDTCIVYDRRYTFVRLVNEDSQQHIYVYTIQLSDSSNSVANATKVTNNIFSEDYSSDFYSQSLILSDPQTYLLTNKYLFDYVDYTNTSAEYTPIKLLFNCIPVGHYYSGNKFDCIYLATENALYVSNTDQVIEVSETTTGDTNFILPEADALLENYYLGKGNELYISKLVDNKTGEFKWYLPEISKQTFDSNITNLHPISNSEVAIFFEDEVWYSTFDAETVIAGEQGIYRYYKSKLQTGCKKGSDVLTTFDGKYTIFASNRGLVAMSYQDYIASTEQSLTYLSDTIYSVFENYITDSKSSNQVKLFKFGYWIVIYKQDSNKGFIFDIRNNSWWPISGIDDSVKFVNIDNSVKLLSNGKMYELNKLDTNYFDYDGKKRTKIDWFVRSQKLHLSALNNYKHISNITFVSVHDSNILQNTEYNINELDFRLQVNCYRKKINGNINEPDDFVNVNYKVETIRTFVQRLNYSKVNEFQYQLSSDEENAIEIPLSLNSITIKYKIGGQVR